MINIFSTVYDVEGCLEQIRECLETGMTGPGAKTQEFENAWKKYTKFPNAHFLNSATAGLNLAVRILKEQNNWSNQDEIISTPLTFVATNNAIVSNNMKLVFADINDTLCLDPESICNCITKNTKAIMYVGIGGNGGDYDEIVSICKKYDLKLIIDAAHMAGTRWKGDIIGKEADVIIFSFQSTKNLPTADSGMICFKERKYDEIVRKLSWNGMDKSTSPAVCGKNYRWKINVPCIVDAYNGNAIMAAIGLAQLPHLDEENEKRREIASWYCSNLSKVKGIRMIRIHPECQTSQWLFQILVDNRDGLMEYLDKHEVYCSLHYLDNSLYPMYQSLHGCCPNVEYVSNHAVSLPLHLRLTKNEVDYVSNLVRSYVEKRCI